MIPERPGGGGKPGRWIDSTVLRISCGVLKDPISCGPRCACWDSWWTPCNCGGLFVTAGGLFVTFGRLFVWLVLFARLFLSYVLY